jgi:hypothetical protein
MDVRVTQCNYSHQREQADSALVAEFGTPKGLLHEAVCGEDLSALALGIKHDWESCAFHFSCARVVATDLLQILLHPLHQQSRL